MNRSIRFRITLALLVAISGLRAQDGWKLVDEGFRMRVPESWRRQDVQPIDSNAGRYQGATVDLAFELTGVGLSEERAGQAIAELQAKDRDRTLLKPGEEIWKIEGKLALFVSERDNTGGYRFANVARIFVPYAEGGGLGIRIYHRGPEDLLVARQVLQSLSWPRVRPGPIVHHSAASFRSFFPPTGRITPRQVVERFGPPSRAMPISGETDRLVAWAHARWSYRLADETRIELLVDDVDVGTVTIIHPEPAGGEKSEVIRQWPIPR